MEKQIQKILDKAKKDKQVIAVALFGSFLKSKGRDIDLCLFLDKKYSNLEMSKKRMEYLKIAERDIDLQIFQQVPVYIRIRIIKEGKILLTKNSSKLYELAFSTIKEFDFYKKLYNMYLNEVENGQKKNTLKNRRA